MIQILLVTSVILLLCVASSKLLHRFGVPSLIIFMGLGLAFGSEGLGIISLDNYDLTRQICSTALIFIIFYGGFGTSWPHARPVAAPSILMASFGVVLTAGITGVFCVWLLDCTWLEGLLVGSVISSTDAASVFSILRSRNLNLKNGLASLLEMESGSNDPAAYMLTIIVLGLILQNNDSNLLIMLIKQVGIGLGLGAALALLISWGLSKVDLEIDGLYSILIVAVALLGYALSEYYGGNGYLCVYVSGIILGNSKLPHKRTLFPIFDAFSWSMQIALFFTMGLLAYPSHLPPVVLPGIGLFLFMLVVARPIACAAVLSWFKMPLKQQALVSFVGLRGAASIVFAIIAVTYLPSLEEDLFHLIFMVCILSLIVQGSLLPWVAHRLDLVEKNESVLKTFTDYEETLPSELVELGVEECSPLADKSLKDAVFPDGTLVVMIKRDSEVIIPNGATIIRPGDKLVVSAQDREVLEEEARSHMGCTS